MSCSDDETYGPDIEHFNCIRYCDKVLSMDNKPVVFGTRGDEACFAVYEGLVGDAFSDVRTEVAEEASNHGLAILYGALLKTYLSPNEVFPYSHIEQRSMSASNYKNLMIGPVYDAVVEFMHSKDVEVINDVNSFLLK